MAKKYATFFLKKIEMDFLRQKKFNSKGEASLKKKGKFGENLGFEKTDGNSQFQFGNCEHPGGGLDFQKCLNYKSGSDPILERRIEN